ncbi:MAG: carboxypeptidase-like regulatory domain-containing protein, partial [Desulfobacterales bacterium]|nr:carboxypeptidase-like regulatory domain-containing protein [Desulfobacterales bacterium]
MKRNTLLLLLIASFELLLHAQTTKVEGTLLDESGEPLPGVNIIVQGTNVGTITNLDGYYSIEAPIGSTLVVSFVGFEDQYIYVGNTIKKNNSQKNQEKFIHLPVVSDKSNIDLYGKHSTSLISNSSLLQSRLLQKKYSGVSLSDNLGNKNISLKKYLNRHRLGYSSGITFIEPYRIPQKQQLYTQGRPQNGKLVLSDSETGEIFSWGPSFNNAYENFKQPTINNNGDIVSQNEHKNLPCKYRNSFFQKGVSTNHSFSLHSHYAPRLSYRLFYNHADYKDIIPNS